MGVEIDRDEFTEAEFERFAERLQACLVGLRELLARPGFGKGPATLGAELELCLVDAAARPLLANLDVLADCRDPRVTTELCRFNLEVSTHPQPLGAGRSARWARSSRAAGAHGAAAATAGAWWRWGSCPHGRAARPDRAMTDLRYRALSRGIRRLRRAPSRSRSRARTTGDRGRRHLQGANTDAAHLRVEPPTVDTTTRRRSPPRRCWLPAATARSSATGCGGDARGAVQRAVDERDDVSESWRPARVSFGNGWAREPSSRRDRGPAPAAPARAERPRPGWSAPVAAPALSELRLRHGTVRWNRAIYDPADGGHLRIELRAAGRTVRDRHAGEPRVLPGSRSACAPRRTG
jgi:hypothetical protein